MSKPEDGDFEDLAGRGEVPATSSMRSAEAVPVILAGRINQGFHEPPAIMTV
jgi:hypothetical protein